MRRERRINGGLRTVIAGLVAVGVVMTSAASLAAATFQIGPPPTDSRVPQWDARGVGALAWQGIACAEMTGDGRHVALGTIAPPGDPQVFLLDERGKIVWQGRAGERWVHAVAVADGGCVAALCTTPFGTAGDRPILKAFAAGKELPAISDAITRALPPADVFHYGDHSNHLAPGFAALGDQLVVAGPGRIACISLKGKPETRHVSLGRARGGVVTGLAASPAGRAAAAWAVRRHDRDEHSRSLAVIDVGKSALLWSRPVSDDAAAPPAPDKGVYGPAAGAYEDSPVWAPLAVAIDTSGKHAAAADYRGWNRRFDRGRRDYGIRFVPTRPTVHVYDAGGKAVRRFGPETFGEPFWCDLLFCPDGETLLAFPHSWPCRGLGGQAVLPAAAGARRLYALNIRTGGADVVELPDAVSSVAVGGSGRIVVGCWDRRVYVLDAKFRPIASAPRGLDVGAASLVGASRDGRRILVAGTDGVVRMLDADAKELWRNDLNRSARPGDKPWTRNQRLGRIAPGVWRKGGARTHSDLGGQYVIEAPRGLLLVDANAGLSIEQAWAQMKAVGLDPMRVRYVLLTHEHGDHAPGAYLWRVLTGAQVVAGAEAAYSLRHHIPTGTGYGFHPPQPVDVVIDQDRELDLAGLKVKALRLPGHTYGSMGYAFEKGGRTYVATGDLIMSGGVLGYSGSVDFSAKDVLASLRKLRALGPDEILGGHGGGEPGQFIAAGIAAGEATGWSRTAPEKPNPFYAFTQKNYLVVAWLGQIASAAYGDVNGDGSADVAVLDRGAERPAVRIFLNRGGKFPPDPDVVQGLGGFTADSMSKIRLLHVNRDKVADVFVSSERGALVLLSGEGELRFRRIDLRGVPRAAQVAAGDFNGDGRTDLLLGQRFVAGFSAALRTGDGAFRIVPSRGRISSYFDIHLADVNGDRRADLITSAGEIFLRQADGSLSREPSIRLAVPGRGWTFMAAADFNRDGWLDVVLLRRGEQAPLRLCAYYHSRDPRRPFGAEPSRTFTPAGASVLRDGPTVGDWNGDGCADLVLPSPQGAVILLGSAQGLSPQRTVSVKLDYKPHYDTRLGLADFNADGKADLAGWGPSRVGAVGVYIWLQP